MGVHAPLENILNFLCKLMTFDAFWGTHFHFNRHSGGHVTGLAVGAGLSCGELVVISMLPHSWDQ